MHRLENGGKEENGGVSVEVMTLDDLQTALKWARQGGMNPGDGDAEVFLNADEKGFFIAKTTDGEPIASVSGVRYTEDYGFIGLYICVPEHRGKGYGKFTFGYAIRHLEGTVIGLNSVAAQRLNYAKWGFAVAHKNISFGGVVNLDALPPLPVPMDEAGDRIVIEDLKEVRIGTILKFDEKHVPAARERFMRVWLTAPGHVVRVAIIGDKIKGYGVLRPSCDGLKIGPLFAESVTIAELLMRELIVGTSQGAKVFIDIPEPNQASIEMAGRLGLTKMFDTYRMYRGPTPKLPMECIYGLTCLYVG